MISLFFTRLNLVTMALFCSLFLSAQVATNYTFSATTGTFTTLTSPTNIIAGGSDDVLSSTYPIGFNFIYECNTYTQFKASSNGWLTFNTSITASNAFNNLATSTDRGMIAPLWDDLALRGAGSVNYLTTGVSPNRVLTVEWLGVEWNYLANNNTLSFQVKLYEGTNRIEFIYNNGVGAANNPSASIGISGSTSGDFISLNGTGASPTASTVTETTNLSVEPATGQIYRFDLSTCSGTPNGGSAALSPSTLSCTGLPITLSVTGATSSPCGGLSYQWQSAPNAGGPWTNIAGATGSTYATTHTSAICFRRIITCGGNSSNSNSICLPAPSNCTLMGNGTTAVTCGQPLFFYDSGGSTADYSTNENYTMTFTVPAGNCVQVSFNNFDSESCCDDLYAYDGPTSGSTLIGNYFGTTSPGTITSTGTSMTFVFTSDGSVQYDGWDATISCVPACTGTPAGGVSSASPSVSCPSGFTATLSLTGQAIGCGITYQWQSSASSTGPWANISGATSATSTTTVSGTTYYQCVLTCLNSGQTGISSVSTASVTTGPANDNCSGAITLTSGACQVGNVACASQSQAGCSGTANDDIWYTFTAPATSATIQLAASTNFDPVVQLFSGTCGSLVPVNCDDASFTTGGTACKTYSGLTTGATYFLRVYDYYTGFPSTTTFTLCLTSNLASCGLNYTAASTACNYESFTGSSINMSDDILHATKVPIGFVFCFDGFGYSDLYISSNSSLVFDAINCTPNIQTTTYAAPGVGTGWSIPGPIPNASASMPRNAILGPWHDIYPTTASSTDDIKFSTLGTAPNRRFVVQFGNIPMFSGSCNSNTALNYFGQIKLYETTNDIEIHMQSKQACTAWNNGQAILGLHNFDGTQAVVPAGYNANSVGPYNQWSATNTAFRFTTPCASCIILPVNFLSFSAQKVDEESNYVLWKTGNEQRIAQLILERSSDGVNFEAIYAVNPKGDLENVYEFTDKLDKVKTYYYRIKSIDLNGEESKSGLAVVKRYDEGDVIVSGFYPNPSESLINADIDVFADQQVTMMIYDLQGKVIASKSYQLTRGFNAINFDLNNFSNGLYYITVVDQFGSTIFHDKVIKN